MNRSTGRFAGGTHGSQAFVRRRLRTGCLLAAVLLSAGCGGGSTGHSSYPPAPSQPPSSTQPNARGTLVVAVTDVLGMPIAGADIRVNTLWSAEDKSAVTDKDGAAEIRDVIASTVTVYASNPEAFGSVESVAVPAGDMRRVTVTAHPSAGATGGVAWAAVSPSGVGDEGRTLEFSLSLLEVPDPRFPQWMWWSGNRIVGGHEEMRVLACTPDPSNDGERFHPDCLSGSDGLDAPYQGLDGGEAVSVEYVPGQGYDAIARPDFASALLLDQSVNAIIDDPADRRLYAAQYLFAQTHGASDYALVDQVALAAFAADDTILDQPALIPQRPVTVFPVENPRYTMDGREFLPEIKSLSSLEGGAAPLFEAIDRMLDFAGGRKDTASSLVVVTNGRDTTCGTAVQCRLRLDALARKIRDKGVSVVAVGLEGPSGSVDYETLSTLSHASSGGAMFRAADPRQLVPIFRAALLHGRREGAQAKATFRIRSEAVGSFASGRTVLGQVRVAVCPFDCTYTYIPFAVRIP